MAKRVLFAANDGSHGTELWVTDGTDAGTSLIADISTSGGSYPTYLTALDNGEVVFAATDATAGYELWVTDGTAAGTSMVLDIATGYSGSSPSQFTALGNGQALFRANDGTNGNELWITDGTAAGTSMIQNINPSGDSNPFDIVALGNGKEVFRANDGAHGNELWVTDGSGSGTSLVLDINPGTADSNPGGITLLGTGTALFSATDATHGNELWVTDGTTGGTSIVMDINPGAGNATPIYLTALGNGTAVFGATDGTHGFELWVTDGTTAHTSLVADINPGAGNSFPQHITLLGSGKALFAANDGVHGQELWVTDGTAAGTSIVLDINPSGDSTPSEFTALGNGKAVFAAADGANGLELWVTDGTAAGTSMVKDIYPGATGSHPRLLRATGNGQAMFAADDGSSGYELWATDGTAAGTTMVQDIAAGSAGSSPAFFTLDTVCFCAGTTIATPTGDVAVERLAVGDAVKTVSGLARPIVWIGTGRVLVTPGRRSAATPVIVHKGALADNVPNRDLHVTKGHSLYLEGSLIPVEFLVNHRSITWDDRAREVTIYHVELASHDVLLANGALAESYRDDGNRWLFHNANTGWDRPPLEPCAPVLTGGPVLDALWRRLLERAGPRPGVALTDDPDLHLLVGGERVDSRRGPAGQHIFRLPKATSRIRIVSRSAVPQELGLAPDPRQLGVAVRRIVLVQGRRLRAIEADDPALAAGFHAFEPVDCHRWTDGDAVLPAALLDGLHGPMELELHVGCTTQYPLIDVNIAAAA